MNKNKWFKHWNNAHQGQTIQQLWSERGGPEVIAFYWTILEMVSLYEAEPGSGLWEANLSFFKSKLGMNRNRSYKLLCKIGETFDNATDMSEAARVQHITVCPGKTLHFKVVPQITMIDQAQAVGGIIIDQHGDRPAPWLHNTTQNKNDILFRMPVFYFRRPFNSSGVAQNAINHYQIVLTACIEFRNLDDDN